MNLLTTFGTGYILVWLLLKFIAAAFLAYGIRGIGNKYGVKPDGEAGLLWYSFLIVVSFSILC